jgi:hypothetical protein
LIFYPVLKEEYATQIARDGNAEKRESGVGNVTRFSVRTAYLSKFEVRWAQASTRNIAFQLTNSRNLTRTLSERSK